MTGNEDDNGEDVSPDEDFRDLDTAQLPALGDTDTTDDAPGKANRSESETLPAVEENVNRESREA